MIVRKFKAEEFDFYKDKLIKSAQRSLLDASFDITVRIDDKEYILKIQPEGNNMLIALQAVEVGYDSEGCHTYAIITDNRILMSLLEILIWQKTAC